MGRDQRGRRRRRHAQGATVEEVQAKLAVLQAEVDHPPVTVGEWTTWWLDMLGRTLKQSTARTYGTNLRYLHPLVDLRLDRLTPEHLERVNVALTSRGVGAETIQGVHRCVRSSLAEPVRRQKLERNPALVGRPRRSDHHEIQPLSLAEAQALLAVAQGRRNGLRWEIALALGLRQGEALGLQWADVDLDRATLPVRRALQRGTWGHGCPPNRPCGLRPYQCPRRRGGGLIVVSPKSAASHRTIVLPAHTRAGFEQHRRQQLRERQAAGPCWPPGPAVGGLHSGTGWVFTTETGSPIDPARDWKDWKALLGDAGMRDARLHDARHSAATFLLVAGVELRTVMQILGRTQPSMVARYQHVIDQLKVDAANRIGSLLWADTELTRAPLCREDAPVGSSAGSLPGRC
jgi:integrase